MLHALASHSARRCRILTIPIEYIKLAFLRNMTQCSPSCGVAEHCGTGCPTTPFKFEKCRKRFAAPRRSQSITARRKISRGEPAHTRGRWHNSTSWLQCYAVVCLFGVISQEQGPVNAPAQARPTKRPLCCWEPRAADRRNATRDFLPGSRMSESGRYMADYR